MKKTVMITVALMLTVNVKLVAKNVEVGSFTYLNELLGSSEECTITIGKQIISENDYEEIVANKTINGDGNTLIGSSENKIYRGLKLSSDGKLAIRNNLMMEKFEGAVRCGVRSELSIVDGRNITFSSNHADGYGGAMFCYESNLGIDRSNLTFSSNHVDDDGGGGAMYGYNSNLGIDMSNLTFSNNHANEYGGATYHEHSSIRIINSSITFSSNCAMRSGGAMTCSMDSNVSINGSRLTFSSNCATKFGGAMACGNSSIRIINSSIIFSSNHANEGGGAMYYEHSSVVSIVDSNLIFSSNHAKHGCAMACYNSNLGIINSSITFSSNRADDGGDGAMSCQGSNISIINSNITFSSNHANDGDGGAMACYSTNLGIDGSNLTLSNNDAGCGGAIYCNYSGMKFTNSQITFDSNIAKQGGGAYIQKGVIILTNARFINNRARVSGGGVYLEGGELTLVADSGKVIEFSGNTAKGKSNGIYIEAGGGTVKFKGQGEVNIYDAIDASNGDIIIECKVNLKTEEDFEARNLTILENGILNMQNRKKNKIRAAKIYRQRGEWAIDIKKELERGEFYVSDYLEAGEVVLGEASKLAVDMSEITDSKIRLYRLIRYGSLEGEFKEVEFTGVSSRAKYNIVYDYENEWVTLLVEGEAEVNGEPKTMGENLKGGQKVSELNNIRGYFISNIIKGVGREGIGIEVERKMDEKSNERGIWVDIGAKGVKEGEEGEEGKSPEEYKEEIKAITVGYDKKTGREEGNRIGVYGRYKELEARQGENKGEVRGGAIGLYASSSKGNIDIKAAAEGRVDKYTTTRETREDKRINDGKFGGVGIAAQGEVVYNGLKRAIRPYAGIRIGVVRTEGFKEEGESPLEVKDKRYVRGSIRTGIRTRVEKNKIKCKMGVGLEYCVIGMENEINGRIMETGEEFRIKGVKEAQIRGEGEIGIEYEINDKTGIYAKGLGGVGSYRDIGGNIGVRYVFGR